MSQFKRRLNQLQDDLANTAALMAYEDAKALSEHLEALLDLLSDILDACPCATESAATENPPALSSRLETPKPNAAKIAKMIGAEINLPIIEAHIQAAKRPLSWTLIETDEGSA